MTFIRCFVITYLLVAFDIIVIYHAAFEKCQTFFWSHKNRQKKKMILKKKKEVKMTLTERLCVYVSHEIKMKHTTVSFKSPSMKYYCRSRKIK